MVKPGVFSRCVFAGALWLAVAAAAGAGPAGAEKIVIAHRGACAYLPEHTLEAYAMAYALGADYIEQDLVLTRDARFVCLHDVHLEDTTNIEEVFPDRQRADGKWYAADFTLEEIKGLSVHERLPGRFPVGAAAFEVPSFEEAIELIQGLNKACGGAIGIYPELKKPAWHRKEGLPMEEAFAAVLQHYGYVGKTAKCYVQCFEAATLKTLRKDFGSQAPQILLIGGGKKEITEKQLEDIAAYAEGIGPDKSRIETQPGLVQLAHKQGLAVHPYTMRADCCPGQYKTVEEEFKQFYFTYGVDGLFTDHPGRAARLLAAKRHP